jgi:hypothetical protein
MEREHPLIFAEHKAGKISTAEAIARAGYRKRETPRVIIERAWQRASASERKEIQKIICGSATTSGLSALRHVTSPAKSASAVFDRDGRLTPEGKNVIETRIKDDNLCPCDVMDLLGFDRLNCSLWTALRRPIAVRNSDLRDAVCRWVNRSS